jgi:hypothetical protein
MKQKKKISMTYSQIWLSPLVDDCQSTYAINLKKETHVSGITYISWILQES